MLFSWTRFAFVDRKNETVLLIKHEIWEPLKVAYLDGNGLETVAGEVEFS